MTDSLERSTVLSATAVTVRFAGVTACVDVDLEVRAGEILAIIGPNGAGKTSLVNALTGASHVESGASILLTNGAKHQLAGRRADRIVALGVSRTFQNLLLIDGLTVAENVLLGRLVQQRTGVLANLVRTPGSRREDAEHRAAVRRALQMVELDEHRATPVEDLPYGLRKRVELARAFVGEPRLLVLDEPVAGMSRNEKLNMADYIVRARDAFGCAVLLIEHDMGMVMSISDRVMAMDSGRRIFLGTPSEAQADSAVKRSYLGAE